MQTKWTQFRSVLAWIIQTILSPICDFEWSLLYCIELDSSLDVYVAEIPTKVAPASESEIAEIVGVTRFHTHDVLMTRLQAGNICLVARSDGKVAGFNWVVFNNTKDAYFHVEPDKCDVYCMDARTYEGYRGQGLHTELLSRLLICARDAGRRRAYTRVSAANASSWKSHLRLGWKEVGSTFMVRPKFLWRRRLGGPTLYPLRIDPSA